MVIKYPLNGVICQLEQGVDANRHAYPLFVKLMSTHGLDRTLVSRTKGGSKLSVEVRQVGLNRRTR